MPWPTDIPHNAGMIGAAGAVGFLAGWMLCRMLGFDHWLAGYRCGWKAGKEHRS